MTPEAPVQAGVACAQCGRTFPQYELVRIAGNYVCGGCKQSYLSRVMASGAAGAAVDWRYAGVWIRWGASIIDSLILTVPLAILFAIIVMPKLLRVQRGGVVDPNAAGLFAGFMISFFVGYFLIVICYDVVMLRYWSATLGKMACGLKVIRPDGSGLGWGVCVGRVFMWKVVTSGIPYLNFVLILVSTIMAGTDSEKRALHDRVCDTRVVYKQSVA